jgi:hypothetical protein
MAKVVPNLGHGFAVSACAINSIPAPLEFDKRHTTRLSM